MTGGPTSFSRFPDGLLDLLQSKHLGKAPNELSDVVDGGVDMWPFWIKPLLTATSDGGTVQNVGDQLVSTVPAGQIWRIYFANGNVVSGAAAEVIRFSFFIRLPGTAVNVRFANSPTFTSTAAGQNMQHSVQLTNRILVPAGATIGIGVDQSNLAAARTTAVSFLIARIPTV